MSNRVAEEKFIILDRSWCWWDVIYIFEWPYLPKELLETFMIFEKLAISPSVLVWLVWNFVIVFLYQIDMLWNLRKQKMLKKWLLNFAWVGPQGSKSLIKSNQIKVYFARIHIISNIFLHINNKLAGTPEKGRKTPRLCSGTYKRNDLHKKVEWIMNDGLKYNFGIVIRWH